MFSPEDHRMLAYAPRPVPLDHRRWKTTVDVAPNCPRCDSSNTKFCYYNNYSLTQPRYFCKGCRRYWTKGGSLRNVPVGGGCRKNRRGKAVRLSSSDSVLTRCPSHEMDGSRTRAAEPGVRPDQALDDMFDRCHGPETGGSNIDMAVMYARYLNQTALPKSADEAEDSYGFVPELSSSSTPSTDLNCHLPEFGIGNSGGMESPTIFPTMNVDAFSMSVYPNLGWAAQELGRTPPVEIGQNNHHFQELLIGDWTSIEQSGFEAF